MESKYCARKKFYILHNLSGENGDDKVLESLNEN